ncbi:MAG: hypothetical protein K9H48_19305, partial [Melioribacteraceae bacterium]|nr:hypothetical protein [Melioribacteraceae bacterium]
YDRPADEVRFDHDLFEWYKKLTTIRNENPVLALGDIQFEVMDNEKGFLLIKRVLNGNEIYLVVNNNDEAAKIKIDPGVLNAKSRHVFTELITGSEINFDYETKLELPSYGLAVLKK